MSALPQAARSAARLFDRVAHWPAVILWMLVIFGLSSIPVEPVPAQQPIPIDKVAHFGVFAVLGALLAGALDAAHRKNAHATAHIAPIVAVAVLIGALYGASDEFHQSFVPGRDPDVLDWLADCAGVLAGATAAALVVESTRRTR